MIPKILNVLDVSKIVGKEWRDEISHAVGGGKIEAVEGDTNPVIHRMIYTQSVRDYFCREHKFDPFESNNTASHVYLDESHQLHSKELAIAIETWVAVLQDNPQKPKTGSRKQLIEQYLIKNHNLERSAISRIATMLNPDKSGGAPKSE